MLIKFEVGIASSVLISTWKTRKDNLSILCKKGTLKPAFPIKIFLLPNPEIITAVSGAALIYPAKKKINNNTNKTYLRSYCDD